MRQLHVLGVSDDGDALLLGTSPDASKPSHRIPLDDRLRAAVRGTLAPPNGRVELGLSPKEMQARLRAGETPEAVAKAAGVPLAKVVPYAAPVLAERQRIVDEARAARVRRARGPEARRPMGETVDRHLADMSGLRPESVDWSASRRRDGAWTVTLRYAARGGRRSASWLWRPGERTLTAADAAASRLSAEEPEQAKPKAARRSKPASPKTATAKPAIPKTAAVKRAAKPAAAKSAAAKSTAARPAAKGTTKAAAKPAPRRAAQTSTHVSVGRPAPRRGGRTVEPASASGQMLPPEPPEQPAGEQPAGRAPRRVGSRVPVPSWSDVLLGVQSPPRDAAARQPAARRRRKT